MVNFDRFGPEKIIEVYNPKVGMRGVLVIHNTALGPGKGGIRMTPSVDKDEVARLAETMTWKNAMAELPFGGAKSGIIADDRKITRKKKDEIVKAFALALKSEIPSIYIAGPDMNTAEHEMGVFSSALKNKKACTGKPKRMGGIPHELGSTGFGVYHATLIAVRHLGWKIKGKRVAIEGFGNVGWFVAKFLSKAAKIVAVSDSKGVIYNEDGLNFKKLAKVKKEKGTVTEYKPGKVLDSRNIISVDADILITAAIPDLIKLKDAGKVKAKLIVEGSNIPMSFEVEKALAKRGILIVPDFVANAGGVISSYVEYTGGNEERMFKMVEKKIKKNTKIVLEKARKEKKLPREAALEIAQKRVLEKCKNCG